MKSSEMGYKVIDFVLFNSLSGREVVQYHFAATKEIYFLNDKNRLPPTDRVVAIWKLKQIKTA